MVKQNQFDSIVIGAGMSGGWAAKEFCEQGFNTLLIERGRNVRHLKDYTTNTWEFKHRGSVPAKIREEKLHIVAMHLEKMQCIFLKMNIPIFRPNPFNGFEVIKLVESQLCGQDKFSVGVT